MLKQAKPVFLPNPGEARNQFSAFRCDITLAKAAEVRICMTARSFYRLYANGELIAHGPARAGHNTLRVDELTLHAPAGRLCLAVEPAAYSNVVNYSTNITQESGLLLAEVWQDDSLLAATGCTDAAHWLGHKQLPRHEQPCGLSFNLCHPWLM